MGTKNPRKTVSRGTKRHSAEAAPSGKRSRRHPGLQFGHLYDGVHERIRTSDPRIHTTSALAAARERSWSGLSLHHEPKLLGAAHPVSTPSTDFSGAWLGIGMLRSAKRSPTLSRSIAVFPTATPNFIGILCSILLSYVDTDFAFRRPEENGKPIIVGNIIKRALLLAQFVHLPYSPFRSLSPSSEVLSRD